jgi:hypothetical protein
MKNMNDFKSFKGMKKGSSLITEDVIQLGADYRVRGFDVPVSLINSFKKKAKDSGNDISGRFADTELAEFIAKYVQSTYLNIENLPLDLLGAEYGGNVQVQPQVQPQMQIQNEVQPQGQNVQAQETAQEIPAQEGGQGQAQGQGQIQGQGQGQGQSQGQGQGQIQGQGQGQGQIQEI